MNISSTQYCCQLHRVQYVFYYSTMGSKLLCSLFVCNRGGTIQYHGGLWARELGQAPMLLVFLTPKQALSSHPPLQMVWLYWLQDRDSMTNWYTINHPTTLHTQYETQRPTTAHRWHFALRDVSYRQSCHLSTPSHPQVPPVWPYRWQAQFGCWFTVWWSIVLLPL